MKCPWFPIAMVSVLTVAFALSIGAGAGGHLASICLVETEPTYDTLSAGRCHSSRIDAAGTRAGQSPPPHRPYGPVTRTHGACRRQNVDYRP